MQDFAFAISKCEGLRPNGCDPHPSWGLYPSCLLSFSDLPPPLPILELFVRC